MRFSLSALLGVSLAVSLFGGLAIAADPASPSAAPLDRKAVDAAVTKGVNFLRVTGQAADGSYTKQAGPAFTALATWAVLESGRSPQDPQVANGLNYVKGFVQDDGRICDPKLRIPNYETCVALVCLKAANKKGEYDEIIKKAEKFIKGMQADESSGSNVSDAGYGGAGYGGKGRPDLSNTAFLLDALEAAGDGADDEAVKKALVFVSRCQKLESEHNTLPFAAKDPDGGFIYTPAAGAQSPAGGGEGGDPLRSYGAMTYAGLKSMLFAGVKKDDPRVQAASKWLRKNYSVSENPGMGENGLFYYYHTMAKALNTFGEDSFKDEKGNAHPWRAELAAELIKRQQPDGSWVNSSRKWMEGDPNLCTSFALLSLAYCRDGK